MRTPLKVILPAAGIGSRLGNLTKHYNKALLAIGKRPVIAHIIDWYPDDTEFVIALGYKGQHIKDFLELAYPERKFQFVSIPIFEGPGSGLGATLKQCEQYITGPFFFHANDSIIKDAIDFEKIQSNTMFLSDKSVDARKYRTVEYSADKKIVKKINDKSNREILPNAGLEILNYVGVSYFSSFQEFKSHLKNISIEIGESDFLMSHKDTIKGIKVQQWYDIGSVDQYNQALQELSDFENLAKEDEAIFFSKNKVIKFFANSELAKKRVQRARLLKGIVPEIIEQRENFYVYSYSPGVLLSSILSPKISLEKLLSWSKSTIWRHQLLNPVEQHKFHEVCFQFYYEKTLERINQYFTKANKSDSCDLINGQKIDSIGDLLNKLNWQDLSSGVPVLFHGDFHFENIIETENGFSLIDWRQGFGSEIKYGDIYYDLAKLYHGLIINHKIIRDNQYRIQIDGNSIGFDFHRKFGLIECDLGLKKFVDENGYSWLKVEILTALIFLNIAPLHHHPYSDLLFNLGKYLLNESILKGGKQSEKN